MTVPTFTPDQIRDLRKKLGLNQAKFGLLVGASQQLVSEWETAILRPSRYDHISTLLYLGAES